MNYIVLIICSIILPIMSVKQTKPKFCINCKYFISDNRASEFGRCSIFKIKDSTSADFLITGITNADDYSYCSTTRNYNHMCGKEGKYYKKNIVKNTNIK